MVKSAEEIVKTYEASIMAKLEMESNLQLKSHFTYLIKKDKKIFPYCPISRTIPLSLHGILEPEGFRLRQNIMFDYQAGKCTTV